ncbi:uncharacterized protein C8Q71DRAFT_352767 [Rhodofomes roseus]|uniref:Uncharacterized protein n=1 Tax=Rhodofomes roseus TaxID=34475 RepID=A0ABQ8KSU7_9APHY|nr:uncharacterized protein C8Q71DRAFT_352767 [Rhodofomes roseus]KAH9841895.1 hypothetical protein C8Q71DRAFT_352767 [Rhodofomes roseus]
MRLEPTIPHRQRFSTSDVLPSHALEDGCASSGDPYHEYMTLSLASRAVARPVPVCTRRQLPHYLDDTHLRSTRMVLAFLPVLIYLAGQVTAAPASGTRNAVAACPVGRVAVTTTAADFDKNTSVYSNLYDLGQNQTWAEVLEFPVAPPVSPCNVCPAIAISALIDVLVLPTSPRLEYEV